MRINVIDLLPYIILRDYNLNSPVEQKSPVYDKWRQQSFLDNLTPSQYREKRVFQAVPIPISAGTAWGEGQIVHCGDLRTGIATVGRIVL